MPKYNGFKNWNHWNVSLWIANDEGLNAMARFYRKHYRKASGFGQTAKERAARAMLLSLKDAGVHATPDGAPYSMSTILVAMNGL